MDFFPPPKLLRILLSQKRQEKKNTFFVFLFIASIIIRASLVAQRLKRLPPVWETLVWSLVRRVPWRRKWWPTPVFLPGESHGQRSLVGYTPQVRKESDMTERLHFHFHYYYYFVHSIFFSSLVLTEYFICFHFFLLSFLRFF